MPVIPVQREAAQLLGISAPSLREWMKQPGFPNCDNGYDIDAIKAWRDATDRKNAELPKKMQQIKAATAAEELRQAVIDTQTKQIKLDRLKKDVYPSIAAHRTIAMTLTTVSDLLDQWLETVPVRSGVPEEFQPGLRDRLKAEFDAGRQRIEDEIQALIKHLDELAEQAK